MFTAYITKPIIYFISNLIFLVLFISKGKLFSIEGAIYLVKRTIFSFSLLVISLILVTFVQIPLDLFLAFFYDTTLTDIFSKIFFGCKISGMLFNSLIFSFISLVLVSNIFRFKLFKDIVEEAKKNFLFKKLLVYLVGIFVIGIICKIF